MDIKQVKFTNGDIVRSVLIYKGITFEELSKVLCSVFALNEAVIGFLAEDGVVIPLSLSCQMPELFYDGIYQVLTSQGNIQYLTASNSTLALLPNGPVAPVSNSLASVVNVSTPPVAPLMPPKIPITRPPERRESRASAARNAEVSISEDAFDQILRFISGLRVRALVTKDEAKLLEELLFEDDTLLLAAYSVASSANDAEYLAEICIDVAQSLKTESGKAALAAQEDMFHICKSLLEVNKISSKQLLFLRHLILIRDDVVAAIYDDFQRHQSVDIMATELRDVARESTNQTESTDDEHEPVRSLDGYESIGIDHESTSSAGPKANSRQPNRPMAPSPMSSRLKNVIAVMIRTSQISASEAAILLELINDENEYIVAAYELFEQDDDEEELKDTLVRCAKLEVRKRILSATKQGSTQGGRKQVERRDNEWSADAEASRVGDDVQVKEDGRSDVEYEDDFEEDDNNQTENRDATEYTEDEGTSKGGTDYTEDDRVSKDDTDYTGDERDEDGTDDGSDDIPLANAFSEQLGRHLEDLLAVVGVENVWSTSVPQQFTFTVFAAAHKSLMSVHQAKALCDLYQAKYDLVRAAWEVYSVQGDVRDFTDTLLRIIRDLQFDSNGNLTQGSVARALGLEETSSGNQESLAQKTQQKKEAKEAVEQAKRDLLKHSLEMMIKQEMTSPEHAAHLFERSLNGDVLVDAAIEAYANNRDVSDFLETLQILANHTREQLDAALRRAVASDTVNQSNIQVDVPAQTSVTANVSTQSSARSPIRSAPQTQPSMSPSRPPLSLSVSSPGAPRSPAPASANSSAAVSRASPAPSPLTRSSVPGFPPINGVNSTTHHDNSGSGSSPGHHIGASAYNELRDIVTKLTADQIIDYDTRVTLLRLIASRDDRLISAYEAYRDQNREDLVASLIRVAQREQRQSPKKQVATIQTHMSEDGSEENNSEDSDDGSERQEEEDVGGVQGDGVDGDEGDEKSEDAVQRGLLNAVDQRNILDILVRAGAVPRNAVQGLHTLIARSDARVQNVFLQYEQDKDVYRLIEALKSIQDVEAADDDDEDDEEGSDAMDSDANDVEDSQQSRTSTSTDERFMAIVKSMNMSHLETAALRLAIARDDGAVRTALENFRVTGEEPPLMEMLRAIARKTIEDTMLESEGEGEGGEDGEADGDDEGAERGGSDDGVGDAETISLRSEDRLMSTQSARDHVFPILVKELVKEDIMQEGDGVRVLQQFAAGNAVVSAALDIYDLDSDMAELVDTLQRVARACEGQ